MARTSVVQLGMDCTIRSPRLPLRFPKRGSVLTVRAMHSVAERSSGCIAALFCCTDRVGEELDFVVGPVATLTTSVAAASAARIIRYPSPAKEICRTGGDLQSRK